MWLLKGSQNGEADGGLCQAFNADEGLKTSKKIDRYKVIMFVTFYKIEVVVMR